MDIATALKGFIVLATLTIGVTQVYKEVLCDKNTQKVSILIATFLALVTGTSILIPMGFASATNFSTEIPVLKTIFAVLFYIADLGVTGFLASKGSNFVVDLFNKKESTMA